MAKACAYLCRQCCFIDGFGEFGEFGDLSCTSASNTNCVDTILEQVIVIEYYSKCGYFVRTVREWNSLSEACVNADTVTAFQTQLCHTP